MKRRQEERSNLPQSSLTLTSSVLKPAALVYTAEPTSVTLVLTEEEAGREERSNLPQSSLALTSSVLKPAVLVYTTEPTSAKSST